MDMSIRVKSGTAGTGENDPVLPSIARTSGPRLYAQARITVRDMPYIVRHLHAPRSLLRSFREIPPTATRSPHRSGLSVSNGLANRPSACPSFNPVVFASASIRVHPRFLPPAAKN
jgi:hypothetical protein